MKSRDNPARRTEVFYTGPAMYATIGMVAGIVAGSIIDAGLFTPATIAVAGILASLLAGNRERLANTAVLVAMAAAGMTALNVSEFSNLPLTLPSQYLNNTVTIAGVIEAEPRFYDSDAARVIVDVASIVPVIGDIDAHGDIPVYIYREAEGLAEGAGIRVRGTVKRYRSAGGTSPYKYRIVASAGTGNEAVVTEPPGSAVSAVRSAVSALIDRRDFGGHREIVRAVTIGDRAALPPDTMSTFARSGIAHVLAVSGLHAGIVALALGALLSILPLGRGTRAILIALALIGYAAVCGFRPPVLRAAVMLTLLTIGPLFGRSGQRENSLAVALIIILAVDPESLFGASLQLSFAAVWGIITFHKPLMRRFTGDRRLPYIFHKIVEASAISIIAFLTTAPIVAAHFGRLPLFSLVANLPAVFLILAIVPLSWTAILAGALGPFGTPVAEVAAYFSGWLLQLLHIIAHGVASLPFASPDVTMPVAAAVCFAAGIAAFARRSRHHVFQKAAVYLPLIAVLIITWQPIAGARNHTGRVIFFDVGQGDAALVEYSDGRRFLVDAGPRYGDFDSGAAIIAPYLARRGIGRLDGVFISHCHSDHTGGIDGLLDAVDVETIYSRADVADSLSRAFGQPVTGISAGDSIAFHGGGILVMAPGHAEHLEGNDASLLLMFTVDSSRILFTGDIEEGRQRICATWRERLAADMLKSPHHGGDMEVSFLDRVNPAVTVISCGAHNVYGHPEPEVLARLADAGSTIARTDRDGTVSIGIPSLTVSPH